MKSKTCWIIGGVFVGLLALGALGISFLALLFSSSFEWSEPEGDIAIVEVKGPIFSSESINEKLEKFRKKDEVKAVVLRIDSPGGAVAPSQEIYVEVKKLAEKKTVVVSMGTVAASGGYYIAAPATQIVANPGTLTGSIGVLMEHLEIEDLLKWARISAETLKAGKMKDAGSVLRKMTPEERVYLEAVLKNMHEQFLRAVSEGRKINLEDLRKIADGRIFTGEQALQVKLVDQLGNLEDAILLAKNLAHIPGEPKLIKPEKSDSLLKELFWGSSEESEQIMNKIFKPLRSARALYWMSL